MVGGGREEKRKEGKEECRGFVVTVGV